MSEPVSIFTSDAAIMIVAVFLVAFFFDNGNAAAKIADVVITESEFIPRIVVVQKGDQIRWLNRSPFAEEPDSMPHGWDNPKTQPFRKPDYPELDSQEPILVGNARITKPLTRVGWWGYHNHATGSFWHGVIIIPDPVSGEPNPDFLKRQIPTGVLRRGMHGREVEKLQTLLKHNPALYPEGLVTGYFGPLTEAAVHRFQERYGLINFDAADQAGVGAVGPATLKKLQEVFGVQL